MDGGTLKDYLEDVISERDALLEELEKEKETRSFLLNEYGNLLRQNAELKRKWWHRWVK